MGGEGEPTGIALDRMAVGDDTELVACVGAVNTQTGGVEAHTPDVEELPQGVGGRVGGLEVEDAGGVMRVEGRQEPSQRVDADLGVHRQVLAVDDDVEVLVGVNDLALGRKRGKPDGLKPRRHIGVARRPRPGGDGQGVGGRAGIVRRGEPWAWPEASTP